MRRRRLKIEYVCIIVLIVLFYSFIALNIFSYRKGRVSVEEKRELLEMPKLNKDMLLSGKFIKEFDAFLTDNIVYRKELIDISKKINALYSINKKDDIVFLDNNIDFFDEGNEVVDKDNNILESATDENKIEVETETIETEDNQKNLLTPQNVLDQSIGDVNDFKVNGSYILYKGLPYFTGYTAEIYFSKTANIINDINKIISKKTLSVMPVPTHTIFIDDEKLIKHIGNQIEGIDKFLSKLDDNIIKIDLCEEFLKHKDEYLYYYSDHHWTHLACYYAYVEFCKSVGIEPHELSYFDETILTNEFVGTVYDYTHDERTKDLKDVAYAYLPRKSCKMKNYYKSGIVRKYESCVVDYEKGYPAFIGGDSAVSVIEVEENNKDDTILVIKDSYGNGFIPFLTEHYGKIVVYDPRYIDKKIYEYLPELGMDVNNFKDILIITQFFTCNSRTWIDKMHQNFDIVDNIGNQ